jgi:hypothetical protein
MFDQLIENFSRLRDSKLASISSIFDGLKSDISSVNKLHNDLIYGRDLALRQQSMLSHLFDSNKFCAISKMERQYEVFSKSLSYMNYESQRLQEMVQDRKETLDQVKERVEVIV